MTAILIVFKQTQEEDCMADMREIAEALKAGRAPKVKELVAQALAENVSAKEILERRPDRGHGRDRRAFQEQRGLRAGGAHRRPRNERRIGYSEAHTGGRRRGARRAHRDRNREGRPARHRQEPRVHDAQGRRVRDRRPGHGRFAGRRSWTPRKTRAWGSSRCPRC